VHWPSFRIAGQVRVDQLGWTPGETKVAYLLTPSAVRRAPFRVVDAAGHVVLRGEPGANRGRWNDRFHAVQPLDVSALHAAGT
jgi:hypothetical protein